MIGNEENMGQIKPKGGSYQTDFAPHIQTKPVEDSVREYIDVAKSMCTVQPMDLPQMPNSLMVHFVIGPVETKRLKSRAGDMDLAMYIYENILKRAISTHVF
jgi:hypothetical protein